MLTKILRTAIFASLLGAPTSLATIEPFFDDFEGADQMSSTALSDLGWVVGANVFAPDGVTFLYNYFLFPAPNGGPAFCGIDIGQGGTGQGAQQLTVYNDYNNADHNVGNRIAANTFKEFNITADDVGKTLTFSYEAKLGNLLPPTTALALIRTVDPGAGFSVTNFISQDMTNTPATWSAYSLSITIDPSLVGQLFQVGFQNTASNFDPSGIFYDNVGLQDGDMDGDGVMDDDDNCIEVANPPQRDTDGDGHGNRCDADFNGDCIVNPLDLGIFKLNFFAVGDIDQDLNGDGIVNPIDLGIFKLLFFGTPGPSPVGSLCNP